MTGMYVLRNLLGVPPGEPGPGTIAERTRQVRDGEWDMWPAWDSVTYMRRAGMEPSKWSVPQYVRDESAGNWTCKEFKHDCRFEAFDL